MSSPPDRSEPASLGSAEGSGPLQLLTIAWRHKSLLALGLVIGLVLGAIYFAQKAPVYRTSAQLTIVKKETVPLPGAEIDPRVYFYDDYLAREQTVIKSTLVVKKAVEKFHLEQLPSFKGDPTGAIRNGLSVLRDTKDAAAGSSGVLTLGFTGPVAEDCPIILNAVLDSYQEILDKRYKTWSDETVQKMLQAYDLRQKEFQAKRDAYDAFRKTSPPIYVRSKDGASLEEEWLGQVQAKRLNLLVQRAELQGRMDAVERAVKEGRGRETLIAQLTPSPGTRVAGGAEPKLHEQLLELMLREQVLLADYGSDHPDVQAVRKRIALSREFFGAGATDKNGKPVDLDPVHMHLKALRQELADVELSLKTLTGLTDSEKKQIEEIAKYRITDQNFQRELQDLKDNLKPFENQLRNLSNNEGGLKAEVIEPPHAGARSGSGLTQNLMLGGVMGLLLGFGLAYLAEMTDRSFRTPAEIQRRLGLPVVGHIPVLEIDAKAEVGALDPRLVAYYHPKSVQAEAFRGVRTALYFSTHGELHKVIQVTSPNASDGKSTVAANLATSIAQSGKRIVLIDADFRKPRQHRIFGLSAASGLASVIAGEAELRDVIQKTAVPGLSLLPCGPLPSNPAELLTSARFKEMLDVLREEFEFVLIDTPPLLAVSDPSAVAARVDGVLLAVRIAKNTRPNAERAKEILTNLDANVLGVVVNGVGRDGSSEYGYESGYGYGYGYGETGDGSYYQDGEAATTGEQARSPSSKRRKERPTVVQRITGWWNNA